MENNTVKTRFAPSPTGLLHIGGARTALFNYLWARHNGGLFLLRFEDTDRERSSPAFEEQLLSDLEWLGLSPDGSIVKQSARFERHGEVLDELKRIGAVYPCFCSPDSTQKNDSFHVYPGTCASLSLTERSARLAAREPHCWRFAVPADSEEYRFSDRLRGVLKVPVSEIGDFVLVRRDGSYTYLFAVVVDDHDAGITHVIRGEEHLSNVPKQELIYKALGWDIPEWAHIPMILDEARHKLSKRSGAISIASYREDGWSPEAIAAYLATMSWSGAPTDRLSDLDTLSASFDLDAVALVSPVHDPKRMEHFGKLAMASLSPRALYPAYESLFPFFQEPSETLLSDRIAMIAELLPSCATRNEFAELLKHSFAFEDDSSGETLHTPWMTRLYDRLDALPPAEWFAAGIKDFFKTFQKEEGLKGKEFYHTLRIVLTGKEEGAPLALLIACLGKDRTLRRMLRTTV